MIGVGSGGGGGGGGAGGGGGEKTGGLLSIDEEVDGGRKVSDDVDGWLEWCDSMAVKRSGDTAGAPTRKQVISIYLMNFQ